MIARAHLNCSIRGSQISVCLEGIIQAEEKKVFVSQQLSGQAE